MMSPRRSGRRWVIATGAWVLLASVNRGESSAPPLEPGLAAAKSEYETLKSVQTPPKQASVPLPAEGLLELRVNDASLLNNINRRRLGGRKTERELATERRKSENWLIEAMADQERQDTHSRGDSLHAVAAETAAEQDPLPGAFVRGDIASSDSQIGFLTLQKNDLPEKDAAASTPNNPLDQFMASWMTSADFKLMAGRRDIPSPELADPVPSALNPAATAESDSRDFSLLRGAMSSGPAGNPYVRNVEVDVAEVLRADLFKPLAPEAAPAVPATPEAVANPVPIPGEQLKARDDEKYFKQLKRF